MGLGDGAGADANGGEASGGEVGGVGEPGSADELGARMGGEEFLDERILWVCFHRWVLVGGFDGEWEAELGDGFAEQLEGTAGRVEFGCLTDVDLGLGVVWDDVGSGSSGDRSDIEGRGAEDGVGVGGEHRGEVFLEIEEGTREFEYRVIAEVRLGGMSRDSSGGEGGPEGAFGDVDDVHGGRFADDGELVVLGVMFGEVF